MVGALVTMQPEFQQSKFEKVKVPQIQFSTECWTFHLCHREEKGTVQPVQKTGDSPGAVLGGC